MRSYNANLFSLFILTFKHKLIVISFKWSTIESNINEIRLLCNSLIFFQLTTFFQICREKYIFSHFQVCMYCGKSKSNKIPKIFHSFFQLGDVQPLNCDSSKKLVDIILQLLDTIRSVDKKLITAQIRLILGFKYILSSLTIRPKRNDCSNHNCSNKSKLLNMCGIHVQQQKNMCGSKVMNMCSRKVMNMCGLG